jgi:Dickkopf N-terminal cysteine-rich region
MRRYLVLSGLFLGAAACVVHADDDCSGSEDYVCYLEYTPGYGYERVCEWTIDPVICVDLVDDDYESRPRRYRNSASYVDGPSSTPGEPEPANAASEQPEPGSDIPCTRDGQCGTGVCLEGECFYGCEEDTDCGTGDACLLVSTASVCQVPAEPEVECTRSVECGNAQLCLNAACHDSCETTADCTNALDRCAGGVCVPDRSVVSECLLDRECGAGQCIDASCQDR